MCAPQGLLFLLEAAKWTLKKTERRRNELLLFVFSFTPNISNCWNCCLCQSCFTFRLLWLHLHTFIWRTVICEAWKNRIAKINLFSYAGTHPEWFCKVRIFALRYQWFPKNSLVSLWIWNYFFFVRPENFCLRCCHTTTYVMDIKYSFIM